MELLEWGRLGRTAWLCPLWQVGYDGGTTDRGLLPLPLFMGVGVGEMGDDGNRQRRRRRKESNPDNQEGGMF